MWNSRPVPFILAVMLLVVSLGLGAPSISVSVQGIGAGSSPAQPMVCLGGFKFQNETSSSGVKLAFLNSIPEGSVIYVTLYSYNGTRIASSSKSLPFTLQPNNPVLVDFSPDDLSQANPARTSVVVLDGMGNVIYNGTLGVSVQRLSSGKWNGEYIQPINVSYSGTRRLTNWPIKVVLTGDDIAWSILREYPESIHFVNESGALLYYWIEILNTTAHYAVIWVNVTNIPPGGTKIWMIYGAGNFSSYNNGHKVFWFFDDFESPSLEGDGWSLYNPSNNGSRIWDFGFGYKSYRSLNRFGSFFDREDGAIKGLPGPILRSNYNITLEYWDYRKKLTKGRLDRVGIVDNSGNGFGAIMRAQLKGNPTSYIRIDTRVNYLGKQHPGNGVQPSAINNNTWYLMRLNIFINGSIEVQIFNQTGYLSSTPMGDVWYFNDTLINFSRIYVKGGATYFVDSMRVRFTQESMPTVRVDEWYRYLKSTPTCRGYASGAQGQSEYPQESSAPIWIVIPIEINNSQGDATALERYVINFSIPLTYLSDGWDKFYIVNATPNETYYLINPPNSKLLYFWNFSDKIRGRMYFWVNYTVPSGSVRTFSLILVNQETGGYLRGQQYNNPHRVFWYFNDTPFTINGGERQTINFDPTDLDDNNWGYIFEAWMRMYQIDINENDNGISGPYLLELAGGRNREYGPALYNSSNSLGVDEIQKNTRNGNVRNQTSIAVGLEADPNVPNLMSVTMYRYDTQVWWWIISNYHYVIHSNGEYQGESDSVVTSTNFLSPILGQETGSSTYFWIGIRPYHNPQPTVTVGRPRVVGP